MSCLYCLEPFELDKRPPILLECSHTLCKDCVLILRDMMRKCPLHNVQTKYDTENINLDIVEDLRFICEIHSSKLIGICLVHFEEFCLECKPKHKNCKTFTGSKEKIKHYLDDIIDSSLTKSMQINEAFQENQLIDFEDGIVWIEENLEKLNEAIIKIENAVKYNYSVANKLKLLKDYEYLVNDQILPEISEVNQENSKVKGLNELSLPFLEEGDSLKKNLDILKLLQSKISNEFDEEIDLHFKKIQNEGLSAIFFFYHKKINKSNSDFNHYFCYFSQSYNDVRLLTGFGIGRPSQPGASIIISLLEIKVQGIAYSEENIIIEYSPNSFIFDYRIKDIISMIKGEDIFLHLEILGTENFLFSGPTFNNVSVKGVDEKLYFEDFPILYFLFN